MRLASPKELEKLRRIKMSSPIREVLNRALTVKGSRIWISKNWNKVSGDPHQVKVLIEYPVPCVRQHVITEWADSLIVSRSEDRLKWTLD